MKKNIIFYTTVITALCMLNVSAKTTINDNIGLTESESLNDIEFIEDEEAFELGFDSSLYLPFGFNPYQGMVFELSEITYIEDDEAIELGFETAKYLPKDFNPYEGQ